MKTKTRKSARWPKTLGAVGTEYGTVESQQPHLLIWIRRQSADSDKRERLSNQFRRGHAQLEKSTLRSLSNVFDSLATKIMDRFTEAGTVAAQVVELFHPAELAIPFNAAMKPCWLRMVESGIHFEADWSGAVKPQFYVPTYQQHELPSIDVGMSPALQEMVRQWLKNRTDGVWGQVAKTIHTRLEATLKSGLRDGLTLKDMTAEVQKTVDGMTQYQAKRIARTETTGGMNFGGHAERIDLGIEHKEWVSTIDSRTRGIGRKDRFDHISSNGEIVVNKEPFIVSGQKLLYPADGSLGASAGNICNCRCCSVGAWPNSPLKPLAPTEQKPQVRPKGWIEPKYGTAELPTLPMPHRDKPPPTATYEETIAYSHLRGMDAEQRSQQTVDRINLVRSRLTKANDSLESIRLKLLERNDDLAKFNRDLEAANNAIEQAHIDRISRGKVLTLIKQRDKIEVDKRAFQDDERAAVLRIMGAKSKAEISVSTRLNDQLMQQKSTDAARWLSQLVSQRHGKSLTLQIDLSPDDRAFYRSRTKTMFMGCKDKVGTYAHEAAHFLEDVGHPQTHSLCKGFLYHRGSLEKAGWCGRGDIYEVGIGDDWEKMFGSYGGKYVGKYYVNATEILSMGVEKLYDSPLEFAAKDPEYFKFIVGILRGDLL